MPKNLLNGVNDVLKRVQIIKGENGELSSFTDSTIQHEIDTAIQYWNEVLEELYSKTKMPMPTEASSANITLVTGQREYSLPADCLTVRYPLMENTTGYYIFEWVKGYEDLRSHQQIPDNFTGRPNFCTISPVTNKLYMDYIPTAAENGLVYNLFYDKDISLSGINDQFPFNDAVYRALVPVVAEIWKLDQRKEFNEGIYKKRFAQACRYLSNNPLRETYL